MLLGYEVEDAEIHFLSILNNCGYTVDQVRKMAGTLNEYSLFSSLDEAYRFIEAIKTDRDQPNMCPSTATAFRVQIWGQR